MTERPTFSGLWHRVQHLTPALRPHVQVMRQTQRGQAWHVLRDPTSGKFFRVDGSGWAFVGRLNGQHTVAEVWQQLLERDPEQAPTQGEIVTLLGQLSAANLVRTNAPVETEQLLQRGRERTVQRTRAALMNVLFFKIPLFNPDAIVGWCAPVVRPLLGRFGLAAWCAFMAFVMARLAPQVDRMASSFDDAVSAVNAPWMMLVYVVSKTLHEFGHAVMLKRFGGRVPSCGVMVLVMVPSPYVDASDAWSLASKWHRIAVGAAGMMFELTLAGAAALIWLGAAPGTLTHQLAFNTMLVAGISTVVFNANPLMRFDGYFILSDLLGMPNLMQRSFAALKHTLVKRLFGADRPEAPVTAHRGEWSVLIGYGMGAMVYRILLFGGIAMLLMDRMFALGALLALWTGILWFVAPMVQGLRYLVSDAALSGRRGRALGVTMGVAALVIGGLGVVPAPDVRRAPGVVASEHRTIVFAQATGHVAEAHAGEGDAVEEGDAILTLENAPLKAELEAARAQLEIVAGLERVAVDRSPEVADLARQRVDTQRRVVAHLEAQVNRLTLRAPHDGVVVQGDPLSMIGAWIESGSGVCTIVDVNEVRVDASARQHDAGWMSTRARDSYRVEVRRLADLEQVNQGTVTEIAPSGRRDLAHGAMSVVGGGEVAVDDEAGHSARGRRFPVRIAVEGLAGAPGERVAVRFVLPARPLAAQWTERLALIIRDGVRW